jgi:VPDSG-CTERM motif
MKTIRIIIVSGALLASSVANAILIDLTPGGFAWNNRPAVFDKFLRDWNHEVTTLIAGANINGTTVNWSPFTLFGPANFSIVPQGPNTNVSWNLTNTDGYFMQYIWVTSEGGPGQVTDNLYRVRGARFEGDGSVIIDGFKTITSIVFLGTNTIPDTGTTLLLFGLALGIMIIVRRKITT